MIRLKNGQSFHTVCHSSGRGDSVPLKKSLQVSLPVFARARSIPALGASPFAEDKCNLHVGRSLADRWKISMFVRVVLIIFGLIAIFVVGGIVLISLGVGIGAALHWMLPRMELGMSILIGVVAVGMTAQVVARVISSLPVSINEEEEAEPEIVPSEVVYLTRVPGVTKRRKRKPPTRVSKKVIELRAEDKE